MKFTKREAVSKLDSSVYLRLKDGESKVGIFRGEIHEFYCKWVNKKPVVVGPDDPDGGVRFSANFVTQELTPMVWEFGITVYSQLADINEEYDLEKTMVKITRKGASQSDTTYTILPLLKTPLTAAQLAKIAAVPLNILEKPVVKAEAPPPWEESDPGPDDTDMPF